MDGWALAVSTDEGRTLQPLARYDQVSAVKACAAAVRQDPATSRPAANLAAPPSATRRAADAGGDGGTPPKRRRDAAAAGAPRPARRRGGAARARHGAGKCGERATPRKTVFAPAVATTASDAVAEQAYRPVSEPCQSTPLCSANRLSSIDTIASFIVLAI